jgi:hypothetical protein
MIKLLEKRPLFYREFSQIYNMKKLMVLMTVLTVMQLLLEAIVIVAC